MKTKSPEQYGNWVTSNGILDTENHPGGFIVSYDMLDPLPKASDSIFTRKRHQDMFVKKIMSTLFRFTKKTIRRKQLQLNKI